MATFVENCPRCGAKKITFDLRGEPIHLGQQYEWKDFFEVFAVCRACGRSTIFQLSEKMNAPKNRSQSEAILTSSANANEFFTVEGFVNIKNLAAQKPPPHLPENVEKAFREGATSLAIQNWNAAGAMFRAAIDLATRDKLPPPPVEGADDFPGLNRKVRRDLGLRLPWLFENGRLPPDLKELSKCVREDGNDGVHAVLLEKADAEDLLDFTVALLERIYTEPKRLELAQARRDARRTQDKAAPEET